MGKLGPVVIFVLTGVVLGQELPNAPVSKARLATFAVFSTEVLADGVTTRVLYQRHYRELDPVAQPFVHAGVPGQIGGSVLGTGAIVGAWFVLHRAHREGMARWFVRSATAAEGCAVARQFEILRKSTR
jgi:hypothetical protein